MGSIDGGEPVTVDAAVIAQSNVEDIIDNHINRQNTPPPPNWPVIPNTARAPDEANGANLGPDDARRYVYNDETLYGSVVDLNGNCTATAVEIDGYELTEGGTLFATAAHCVEGYGDGDHIISGTYLDEYGNLQQYQMQSADVWVHPFHGDFNRFADPETVDSRADIAFIRSPDLLPEEVTPAEFVPIDMEGEIQAAKEAIAAGEELEGSSGVTVAGFSSDMDGPLAEEYGYVGLQTHENASVLGAGHQVIVTDADTAQGASGGPVYEANGEDEPVVVDEAGRPQVIAVNSAGDGYDPEDPSFIPENAYATTLEPEMAETIPFLEREGEVCEAPTATVEAESGVNVRYGPGISFEELVTDQNGPSGAPWGSQLDIHETVTNPLGEQWVLATGEDGRTGYVAEANLNVAPVVCAPAALGR